MEESYRFCNSSFEKELGWKVVARFWTQVVIALAFMFLPWLLDLGFSSNAKNWSVSGIVALVVFAVGMAWTAILLGGETFSKYCRLNITRFDVWILMDKEGSVYIRELEPVDVDPDREVIMIRHRVRGWGRKSMGIYAMSPVQTGGAFDKKRHIRMLGITDEVLYTWRILTSCGNTLEVGDQDGFRWVVRLDELNTSLNLYHLLHALKETGGMSRVIDRFHNDRAALDRLGVHVGRVIAQAEHQRQGGQPSQAAGALRAELEHALVHFVFPNKTESETRRVEGWFAEGRARYTSATPAKAKAGAAST